MNRDDENSIQQHVIEKIVVIHRHEKVGINFSMAAIWSTILIYTIF